VWIETEGSGLGPGGCGKAEEERAAQTGGAVDDGGALVHRVI
jgi:hypothetical protein